MEVAEYEISSDFEDEEIDSDEEPDFTEEDLRLFGLCRDATASARKRSRISSFDGEEEGETPPVSDEDVGNDEIRHRNMLAQVVGKRHFGKRRRKDVNAVQDEDIFNVGAHGSQVHIADLTTAVDEVAPSPAARKQLDNLSSEARRVVPPVPEIQKERMQRKAAYNQTKKDVSKWQETVMLNRRSETVRFPLTDDKEATGVAKITEVHKPQTDMEQEVAAILRESGIEEARIKKFEALAMNKLSPEQVLDRQRQLSKMRSLCFYAEQKAKRKKKIKSKTYHRILKKQRTKEQLTAEELSALDSEEYKELLAKKEEERIKERFSLKHKNTSKWTKRAARRQDPHSKAAIAEQLKLHEELKRKMQSMSDESGSESDESNEYEEENGEEEVPKGLFAMKFMQRKAEREKAAEIEQVALDESCRMQFEGDPSDSTFKIVASNSSNDTFGQSEPVEQMNGSHELKKGRSNRTRKNVQSLVAPSVDQANDNKNKSDNPWLEAERVPVQTPTTDLEAPNPANTRSTKSLKVEPVVFDPEKIMALGDEENENDSDDVDLLTSQRKLVQEAFAGDNVVKEFEKEKKELMKDADDEPEKILPGWGSWTGEGVVQRKKRRKSKPQLKKPENTRKDANLKLVIINEKRDKKAAKYRLHEVPHPFKTMEQYERSIRHPLGLEWNTSSIHRKMTAPEVAKKAGIEIEPISAMKQDPKKEKQRQRDLQRRKLGEGRKRKRMPKNLS